jgi:predicted transcriptional regulator
MHTLYLKAKKYPHQQIADILDMSPNSVTIYLKMYQAGGIENLKQVNYGKNTTALTHKLCKMDFIVG